MVYRILHKAAEASEAQIQEAIIKYISLKYKNIIAFHVPNAGKRSFQTGFFMKRQGLLKGIPDVCVCWRHNVGFIEVKTPTGRLTAPQRIILERLTDLGIPNAVCRSLDDAVSVLKSWMDQSNPG